jgi:quercetin dioxygenase-like cupin family protein
MTKAIHLSTSLSRRTALMSTGMLGVGALFARSAPSALAQDATQVVEGGGEIEGAPGVWAEVFSGIPTDRAAGQTLFLARFTFFPGSEIFEHGHPGTTSLSVESGSFGWTLVEGAAYVIRGAKIGGTEVEDVAEAGMEVTLEPGDAIYYEDDVVHTARCAGEETTVVNAAMLLTSGEPLLMAH